MFLIRRDPEPATDTSTLLEKFGRTTPLTVLYTGDFRFRIGDTLNLRSLFNENKQLLRRINTVYADTTFCLPQARSIPNREESLREIVSAARKWLARPGCTIVHVFSRSFYGYEFLMHSLAIEFKCKIHVTEEQLVRYEHLPNTCGILTTDSTATRIHFCQVQRDDYTGNLPCTTVTLDVLTIIPSAMYFTKVHTTKAID
jgi:hypothetical protein